MNPVVEIHYWWLVLLFGVAVIAALVVIARLQAHICAMYRELDSSGRACKSWQDDNDWLRAKLKDEIAKSSRQVTTDDEGVQP